jgi:hypothetical protein
LREADEAVGSGLGVGGWLLLLALGERPASDVVPPSHGGVPVRSTRIQTVATSELQGTPNATSRYSCCTELGSLKWIIRIILPRRVKSRFSGFSTCSAHKSVVQGNRLSGKKGGLGCFVRMAAMIDRKVEWTVMKARNNRSEICILELESGVCIYVRACKKGEANRRHAVYNVPMHDRGLWWQCTTTVNLIRSS